MENIKLLNEFGNVANIINDSRDIANYQGYEIPILYLVGDASQMSKDVSVSLNYYYRERVGTCTLKWQGSSSIAFPKKNYTIKFDEAFEVVEGWGEQKKYCLKANYVDSSHSRNIVCSKLWGQMVKTRSTENTTLKSLPNGGAIDGFPIILSINGAFHGIYTWNIPKDSWMFGMDGTGQQAIVCAEKNNNGAVAFNGLATMVKDANGEVDFDLEYSSDDGSEWVVESLNRLISAVKDSDGTNITHVISKYLDLESAIDYYIHAVLIANYDGIYRNYLLATYDGVKWFFTGYDKDVVLGLRSLGKYFYDAKTAVSFESVANMHKVFGFIWTYMRPQLRARYEELRDSVMSVENVANMFVDFMADIPLSVYVDDNRKWNSIPSSSANNLSQIIMYYDLRCRNADEWIKNTSGETAFPEQVNPDATSYTNQVPISIDTDGSVFNGKGWIGKTRLSSSGGTKSQDYVSTTGYIPASSGSVIRISGVDWLGKGSSQNYVCAYNSEFEFISAVNKDGSYGGGTVSGDSKVAIVTLLDNPEIAYIRVSSTHDGEDSGYSSVTDKTEGPGSYLIITVNEEIIE